MPEWLIQGLLIAAPFGSAVVGYILKRFHSENQRRLDHIDECVDKVKIQVARVEGHLGIGIK